MEKITTSERKIIRFLKKDTTSLEAQAFQDMLDFWTVYDAIYHTNHAEIIKTLYSPQALYKTSIGKSQLLHISERTMSRYRNLYLESYRTCYRFLESSES